MNVEQCIAHIRRTIRGQSLTHVECVPGDADSPCSEIVVFFHTKSHVHYSGITLPEPAMPGEFDGARLANFIANSIDGVSDVRH